LRAFNAVFLFRLYFLATNLPLLLSSVDDSYISPPFFPLQLYDPLLAHIPAFSLNKIINRLPFSMTASSIKTSGVQRTIFSLNPGPRPERIDISDGLIMRWSTKADADNVGALLAEAFKVRMEIENAVFRF
jgi:hypothetical protein